MSPVVDLLAEKIVRFGELLVLPGFGNDKVRNLLDCDVEPARGFNRMVVDRVGQYFNLASPVAGTGIGVRSQSPCAPGIVRWARPRWPLRRRMPWRSSRVVGKRL
jgi:hypothetical protein